MNISRLFIKIAVFQWLLLGLAIPVTAQKFYPDDPIKVDDDKMSIPEMEEWALADYYDFVENTFLGAGRSPIPVKALDINTLGEIPDSSWFTNRHTTSRLSLEELVRGPNRGSGPSRDDYWFVIRGKSAGVTPGFVIRDSRGDIYFIKFDPVSNPEMSTSTEMICTKFFNAIGYNVPENYLVEFTASQLRVDPTAVYTDLLGRKKPLDREVISGFLDRVYKSPAGTYRAIASKALSGKPKGPYKYYGTRSDDPNDLYPHQHRRVLRGLYVIAAWLNHDDSRSINTLDTFVVDGDRQYIKHHLMDFGSCLGSGSIRQQSLRAGWEYMVDWSQIFKGIATLGIWVRPYLKAEYPDYPAIGRFESTLFEPQKWKPEYPNPAYENMLPADAFWGAKQVMAFSDEEISAICRTGRISDPDAEKYLIDCLIERRQKTGKYWFSMLLPLDAFRVENGQIVFRNLMAEYFGISEGLRYSAEWFRFDNLRENINPLDISDSSETEVFKIPDIVLRGDTISYSMVRITAEHPDYPRWKYPLEVFLRKSASAVKVVGIERWEQFAAKEK